LLLTCAPSICIISAFRIASIAHLDFADFTFSLVDDGIFSALEPCLGIVNACLPVMQPVFAKFSRGKAFTWTRGPTKVGASNKETWDGTSVARQPLTTADSDTRNFHRLYDHLIPMGENIGKSEGADKDLEPGLIKVTTDWKVHSVPHR
jgi:hypothetical protein